MNKLNKLELTWIGKENRPKLEPRILLEDDVDVMKWFKPAKGQFRIYYHHDQSYEPDFVVETKTAKYLCEPKRATEVDDPEVLNTAA